ncbi:hypothetical protein, partial [Escherichia coli]|uniref:hypothetical protein n=1 Tax=Escherichia coli TaxID=562 RepID=UPI00227E429C
PDAFVCCKIAQPAAFSRFCRLSRAQRRRIARCVAHLPADGATVALRGGARRPANGHLPPCTPLPRPFTDSGLDLAVIA